MMNLLVFDLQVCTKNEAELVRLHGGVSIFGGPESLDFEHAEHQQHRSMAPQRLVTVCFSLPQSLELVPTPVGLNTAR